MESRSRDTVSVSEWGQQGKTTAPEVLRHPRLGLNNKEEAILDRPLKPRQGIGQALRRFLAGR